MGETGMGISDFGMVVIAAIVLGGAWASFLRPAQGARLDMGGRDLADRGVELPPFLSALYPVLWPVLSLLDGVGVVKGNLSERIARSGYFPYGTVSAVWAARLQGLAIGILAMLAGTILLGPVLGTPIPGIIGGLAVGAYGLLNPDREIDAAIRDRSRRFRANMLLVIAAARGFIKTGRAFDDAFSRAAQGDGVFANWVDFLISRHNTVGLEAIEDGRRHAPDPKDPYLIRFLDLARAAWTGGSGLDTILGGMVQDLSTDMEQNIAETVTTVEPLVLGAGIFAIAGYVMAVLIPAFLGGETLMGF